MTASPTAPSTTPSTSGARPWTASVVEWLSAVGAVGTALLAIGHAGVDVPVLSALGPGGDRAVPVAAVGFTVMAVLYATVAAAAFSRTRWAWPAAVAIHGLAVLAGIGQFRGIVSAVGLVLSLLALAVLFSPAGRRDLRGRR